MVRSEQASEVTNGRREVNHFGRAAKENNITDITKNTNLMFAAVDDHVCDPASMFQDTFSLSEFILGQQEENHQMQSTFPQMLEKNLIKEELDSEEEYHATLSETCQESAMSLTYSPCSYVRPNTLPASPASCSSGCSGSSPTGYQPPMAYATDSCGQNRYLCAPLNESTLPYAVYMGYRSRERKRDDDLCFEDREKRRVRRERNKMAALRCRTRRRERIETLEQETTELERQNNDVENEISSLRLQLKQLEQLLKDHNCPHGIID